MPESSIDIQVRLRDKFSAAFTKVQSKMKSGFASMKTQMFSLKGAMAGVAVFFAAKVMGDWVKASNIQEKAMARLRALTGDATDELARFAGQLQKLTTFGDEQIISAEAMLGTFKLTAEQIKAVTPRLLDMAAASEKTTGQQQDLQQVAIAVGKALTGQPGILSRYGVVMDKAALKGDAFSGVLKSLDDNFKGVASTIAMTDAGKMEQLGNLWGDIKEQLGATVKELIMTSDNMEALNQTILGMIHIASKGAEAVDKIRKGIGWLGEELFKASRARRVATDMEKQATAQAEIWETKIKLQLIQMKKLEDAGKTEMSDYKMRAGKIRELGERIAWVTGESGKWLDLIRAGSTANELMTGTTKDLRKEMEKYYTNIKGGSKVAREATKKELANRMKLSAELLKLFGTEEQKAKARIDAEIEGLRKLGATHGEMLRARETLEREYADKEAEKAAELKEREKAEFMERATTVQGFYDELMRMSEGETAFQLEQLEFERMGWEDLGIDILDIEKLTQAKRAAILKAGQKDTQRSLGTVQQMFFSAGSSIASKWSNDITDMSKLAQWRFDKVAEEFGKMVAKMIVQALALKAIKMIFGGPLGFLMGEGGIVNAPVVPAQAGALVTKPTLVLAGEKREMEMYAPLDNFRQVVRDELRASGGGGGGMTLNVQAFDAQSMLDSLRHGALGRALEQASREGYQFINSRGIKT